MTKITEKQQKVTKTTRRSIGGKTARIAVESNGQKVATISILTSAGLTAVEVSEFQKFVAQHNQGFVEGIISFPIGS